MPTDALNSAEEKFVRPHSGFFFSIIIEGDLVPSFLKDDLLDLQEDQSLRVSKSGGLPSLAIRGFDHRISDESANFVDSRMSL